MMWFDVIWCDMMGYGVMSWCGVVMWCGAIGCVVIWGDVNWG